MEWRYKLIMVYQSVFSFRFFICLPMTTPLSRPAFRLQTFVTSGGAPCFYGVSTGGSAVTAKETTDGELIGGIVLLLSPAHDPPAHCRGSLTVRQGSKRYTTQRDVPQECSWWGWFSRDQIAVSPAQTCQTSQLCQKCTRSVVRIGRLPSETSSQPIAWFEKIHPGPGFWGGCCASFKQTLKSDVVESAVRRNLEARQSIHPRFDDGSDVGRGRVTVRQIRSAGLFS